MRVVLTHFAKIYAFFGEIDLHSFERTVNKLKTKGKQL